ncbi:MAG: endonuclease III [Ruminococcaceae bacterium]|nr:endonuclease III [Oscillospiraceae bacterium]
MKKEDTLLKEKQTRCIAVNEVLKELYPEALCSLKYDGDPWRLLVMARLSAQCTDERVNIVSVDLFRRYPTPWEMADADFEELCGLVRSCGLYRTKADSIKKMSRIICEKYGGRVPDTMDELLELPGVGRKIANLILGDVYGIPGIVADTHCIRINGRFGFYDEEMKTPEKAEKILSEIVPKGEQSDYCHRMVLFGREYCMARSPRCGDCPVSVCPKNLKKD